MRIGCPCVTLMFNGLVTSFDQFTHIEKHCTSTAAFQRGQALAVQILLASQFCQHVCPAGTETPMTREQTSVVHTKNSVIRHRGCQRHPSRARQGLFSAFSKSMLYPSKFSLQPKFRRTLLLRYQFQNCFSNSFRFDSVSLRFRVSWV